MSRRAKPEKRPTLPDVRYQNTYIQEFIHRMMRRGKKSVAQRLMYDSLEIVGERSGKNPVETFELAMKNVGPTPKHSWRKRRQKSAAAAN